MCIKRAPWGMLECYVLLNTGCLSKKVPTKHALLCVKKYSNVIQKITQSKYSTAQIYVNCAYAYYTHIRVWVYAHTRMSIRTYAYEHTHIRVYLYAHTRIGIRAYTHIRARLMCLCYSGRKSFLCVSLLWKRKSQSDDPTTKIEIFA